MHISLTLFHFFPIFIMAIVKSQLFIKVCWNPNIDIVSGVPALEIESERQMRHV